MIENRSAHSFLNIFWLRFETNIVDIKRLDSDRVKEISSYFVSARRECRGLNEFPGPLPLNLAEAYRCQDAAIKLWNDQVAGWKVGMINGDNFVKFGTDRLVGPIFHSQIAINNNDSAIAAPIFVHGFAAVEAEFVFKIGKDAPKHKVEWSDQEAIEMVASVHAGVEIASSPLISINDIGPLAVISDFGNNNGLIVGAAIGHWLQLIDSTAALDCETAIDSVVVGHGSAQSIRGGLLASLKFALSMGASRAMPLKAGFYVCAGAVTGVHRINVSQNAHIVFGDIDTIDCRAVEQPRR